MQKKFLVSLCALGLSLAATGAMAGTYGDTEDAVETPASPPPVTEVVEETVDYARTGPYIGLGGNYAFEMFDDNSVGGARTGNSAGVHAKAGYRFHPRGAVEARYEWFNEFDLDPGHIDGWMITANVKGFLLTGRWQPYGLVGLGYLSAGGSGGNFAGAAHPAHDFAMRFGGGMDAHITENLVIGPEFAYVLPTGSAEDLDMLTLSLGVTWRF